MDTALKQRLIGAIVLVALAVIFLPMLVKGPAPDSGVSDVPLKVPDAPEGQYETRELPLVTPDGAPANGAVGLPAATPATSPDAAAPADRGLMPAATAGGNYAVSFGAYATAADADAVIARLKQGGLPGYREAATINGRSAYRVRIGPYPDRAIAESRRLEAVKIRSDVKAQVVVLDAGAETASAPAAATTTPSVAQAAAPAPAVTTQALPPEPARPAPAKPVPAPATTAATAPAKPPTAPAAKPEPPKPAASNVGFAVQLGAFSKPEEATALRDKVRAGGFSAFVEQVRTDKGTLSRVRVGPVASRADADQLKAQVAAKFGISGMVRPHP
ncbi:MULTISPECIES: SPOR domain-containing protein [Pseudoxanthomonas]|uniref:SPOR domain-containing protein n=1 Tax=Pseudoxanthomonas TaxID=83618 RepID=UPI00161654FF|nr:MULTISPECIES: SPOR domain-containing protein [Pseudoxanthomonas]MBB3275216.1 cell division septation protein DedD [Pseudoxanthomonas sp. OG2]MBV7473693.1 SPOR domain-containing protein [Pseudoxanthomonas sp. PXM05]